MDRISSKESAEITNDSNNNLNNNTDYNHLNNDYKLLVSETKSSNMSGAKYDSYVMNRASFVKS